MNSRTAYTRQDEFERNKKRGFKNWTNLYGRSLKVGDEVLFVCDFPIFVNMDTEKFVNKCTSNLKIVEIAKGRIHVSGNLPFVPNYSESFFIKDGTNCKFPSGKGVLKIPVICKDTLIL